MRTYATKRVYKKPSYIQEMQEMEKKSSDQAHAVQITVYLQ